MSFYQELSTYSWETISSRINHKNSADVQRALERSGRRTLEDFMALISPAAVPYLEEMAALSQKLTLKRFGKTIQMYIPLYLSNECTNSCVYCGFNRNLPLPRKTLSTKELKEEAHAIKKLGYDHILLVSGESPKKVGLDYFKNALEILQPLFSHISMEVQPLSQEEYAVLIKRGLNTVLVYQETYREQTYGTYHPNGKKKKFSYRLETPERLGRAGIYKIGLGFLMGLEEWRAEAFFTALHLTYLKKKYWQTRFSISFPRLRPHQGDFQPSVQVTDKELVQLICAYRILDEHVELSLSTRESEQFRDHVVPLGITTISAGSKIQPGGYSSPEDCLKQFDISDARSPEEIARIIKEKGYEPVWKDWDGVLWK